MEKYLRVYDIKWNDPNYVNDWFEVGPFDSEDDCDIEEQLQQQDDDCNQSENRTDLRIISYEYEFVSE